MELRNYKNKVNKITKVTKINKINKIVCLANGRLSDRRPGCLSDVIIISLANMSCQISVCLDKGNQSIDLTVLDGLLDGRSGNLLSGPAFYNTTVSTVDNLCSASAPSIQKFREIYFWKARLNHQYLRI